MRRAHASRAAAAAAVSLALLAGVAATSSSSARAGAPVRDPAADAKRAYEAGQVAPDRDSSRREYQRGITIARAVLARDPDDPGGLLWLAANLGGEALSHGKLHALGVIGEIEGTLLRLDQRHPNYDSAAAARALGRLYHKAPAWISVGDNNKAAAYLEKALARAPEFPGNWAFAADLYDERHDCARALPLARRVAAAPRLDSYGFDAREWRDIAARVQADCR